MQDASGQFWLLEVNTAGHDRSQPGADGRAGCRSGFPATGAGDPCRQRRGEAYSGMVATHQTTSADSARSVVRCACGRQSSGLEPDALEPAKPDFGPPWAGFKRRWRCCWWRWVWGHEGLQRLPPHADRPIAGISVQGDLSATSASRLAGAYRAVHRGEFLHHRPGWHA